MTPADDMGLPCLGRGFFVKGGKGMTYIYVGIAGACGAMLRYFIGMTLLTGRAFPWATLMTNLAGSFILAWLATSLFKRVSISPTMATAISTGFVGSFTTFSTFSVETVELFENQQFVLGVVYVFISIVGGLLMSGLGFKTGKGAD